MGLSLNNNKASMNSLFSLVGMVLQNFYMKIMQFRDFTVVVQAPFFITPQLQ